MHLFWNSLHFFCCLDLKTFLLSFKVPVVPIRQTFVFIFWTSEKFRRWCKCLIQRNTLLYVPYLHGNRCKRNQEKEPVSNGLLTNMFTSVVGKFAHGFTDSGHLRQVHPRTELTINWYGGAAQLSLPTSPVSTPLSTQNYILEQFPTAGISGENAAWVNANEQKWLPYFYIFSTKI